MGIVNKITFARHFIEIRDNWLKDFNENSVHASNLNYFITIFKHKVENAKVEVNMESQLSSKISEIHNQLELDDRMSCLELIERLCNKEGKDLLLTVQQIAEIKALDKVGEIVNIKGSSTQNKNKNEISIKKKTITFHTEIIEKLHSELRIFFDESESENLLILLNGKKVDQKLIFLSNANRLVELFRRIKYNGFIIENYINIENWIFEFFKFTKNSSGAIEDFKVSTIHSILYGTESAQPTKKKRIITVDWLPYKSPDQVKKESQNK